MLSVLIRMILMSTHSTHFHGKIRKFPKIPLNISFLELLEEFPKNSEMSSNQPWFKRAIGFRSLKFCCE